MQQDTDDSLTGVESAQQATRHEGGGVGTAVEHEGTAASTSMADATGEVEAGTVPTFLNEIARQMLAAVESERARISAKASGSLEEHVQGVRLRAANETTELRQLAEADVGEIKGWSAAEADRIRREADDRIAVRRGDLERHLRQHDVLIEREIAGASEAIERYQQELDRFVESIAREKDPTDIAAMARRLPEPPRIEEVASAARSEAIAELAREAPAEDVEAASLGLVGVMDSSLVKERSRPADDPDDAAPADAVRRMPWAGNTVSLVIWLVLVTLIVVLATGLLLWLTGRLTLGS
jgi:hypothetical protein